MTPAEFKKFVQLLDAFPEVGPRQSWRLFFWLIKQDEKFKSELIELMTTLKTKVKFCSDCFFPTLNQDRCDICNDQKRDHTLICLVERETDIITFESIKKFNGVYFILGGLILPFEEKGIVRSRLKKIKERLEKSLDVKEVLIALPLTKEAEPTFVEVIRVLNQFKNRIKITKLRRGLPAGAEVEFLDPETLTEAFLDRR